MKKIQFGFVLLIAFIALNRASAQDLSKSKDGAHSADILCTAISSDGTYILTGGADKRVYLRDGKSGEPVKIFSVSGNVTSVAFSSSGKIFANATADGKVTIYDTKELKYKKSLTKEHQLDITSVAFNPINDNMVTASKDGTAKIWDPNGSGSLFTLKHEKAVNGAVFSPDGKMIATGSSDNTVKIWDATTGELKKSMDADSKEVTAITWSSDGKYIATGGNVFSVRAPCDCCH